MNLENLKNQAKSLLRQHRDRYFPVAARIRRSLPEYDAMSDCEILNSSFALHDAQRAVAREQGFQDWATLRKESIAMTVNATASDTTDAAPNLCCAQPQLVASDVARLAEFYRDSLGFRIDYLYGEPPFYGLVSRDGAHLNLRQLCGNVIDQESREKEQFLSAAIPTENVKSLFLEYQGNGVTFFQKLKRQPWDADDFIVKDPDGNLICFASPT